MAVIVLTNATGAPGVTTTCVALALAWPRPVILLEADPAGGSGILAGYFRGQVPHDRGLVDLAVAHRRGDLAEALMAVTVRIPGSEVQLIPGVRSHQQIFTVAPIWEALSGVLRSLDTTGTDVIVDAGRLGMTGAPHAILRGADAVLLVTRTTLPAVSGIRSWAKGLQLEFSGLANTQNLGLILVGEGHPYSAGEVKSVLSLPVVATMAWDPVSAETFHLGAPPRRNFESAALSRSVRAAVSAIQELVRANRQRLDPGMLVNPAEAG